MKNSKLKYMQNISRSKSFGKFVLIVYKWQGFFYVFCVSSTLFHYKKHQFKAGQFLAKNYLVLFNCIPYNVNDTAQPKSCYTAKTTAQTFCVSAI